MPVLATATLLTLLFRDGAGAQPSLLAPAALRDRVESELPDGESRRAAIAVADQLSELGRRYETTREAVLARYGAHVATGTFSTESILEIVEPLDRARTQALREIVRLRQALLTALSPGEWDRVFE